MNISSVSGMNSASFRMDNTANNVANVNTPDFRPQRVEQVETAPAAPAPAAQAPAAARAPATAPTDTYEPGTGTAAYNAGTNERPDLANDMTNMVADRNAYEANAQTVRAQANVAGTAIDLMG
jgi:flagellar basal-body rod protein FlgC